MKGSIRVIIGLLITLGAVGGIENDQSLAACGLLAVAGLLCMYSGVRAMNKPRTIFLD